MTSFDYSQSVQQTSLVKTDILSAVIVVIYAATTHLATETLLAGLISQLKLQIALFFAPTFILCNKPSLTKFQTITVSSVKR